jgi:hypothetical protein
MLADASELNRITADDATQGRLEELESSGRIFRYDMGGNDSCKFEVFVDARIPDAVRERAEQRATGLLLRLPTGRLVVCGFERLADGAGTAATTFDVPPGDYTLEAFVMPPPPDPPETLKNTANGCGCLLALLSGVVGVVMISRSMWLGWVLAPAPILLLAAQTLWWNLSGARARAERASADGPPEIVVGLVRIDETPPEMRGGRISV